MLLLVLCPGDMGALPLAALLACASAGEGPSALVLLYPGTESASVLPLAAVCGSALLLSCVAEATASCPPPAGPREAWAPVGAAFAALPFPFLPLRAALLLPAAAAEGLFPGFLSLPPCSQVSICCARPPESKTNPGLHTPTAYSKHMHCMHLQQAAAA